MIDLGYWKPYIFGQWVSRVKTKMMVEGEPNETLIWLMGEPRKTHNDG